MPIWVDGLDQFVSKYGFTEREARTLKCTAEHLIPESEGGRDVPDNIVAACWTCNMRRHRVGKPKTPDDYLRYVRHRIAQGKWHPYAATLDIKAAVIYPDHQPKYP
ncbi:HNH endonuclease signature motif containing protein [Asticcacaulis sp. W401b]|uniref:HNH endonuclease signature motif containing protein n=1 Tax=Asticcacaulis sp. W401b TaxID=3388666 RepID=UPI003970671B